MIKWNRFVRNTAGAMAMMFAITGVFANHAIVAYADEEGTVSVSVLNVRSGPSTDDSVISTVSKGTKISIISSENGWYKVNINGSTGYVAAQYVAVGGTSSNAGAGNVGKVNVYALNVRKGADDKAATYGCIAQGTSVNILGTEGNWYKVSLRMNNRDITGYVFAEYVTVSGSSGGNTGSTNETDNNTPSAEVVGSSGQAKCIADVLNVRSGAGMNSSVIGTIRKGTVVTIKGIQGDWYQIETTLNGRNVVAYAAKQYLTKTSDSGNENNTNNENNNSGNNTAANTKGIVSTGGSALNVRSSASMSGGVIGSVKDGSSVTILATEGEWYKGNVQLSGREVTGYLYKSYVKKSGETNTDSSSTVDKDGYTEVNETVWATTGLNIRKGPGTNYGVYAGLAKDTSITRTGIGSNGWSRVQFGSATAYIRSDLLTTTNPVKTSTKGEEVVAFALQFEGNPYVYGGNDLNNGVDCSGFTQQVYKHFGISLNRTADAQRSNGVRVASVDQALPGDLVFYGSGGYAGHVALYIGDGKVIHASSPGVGIIISNVNYRTPMQINRIIN